jgi:hypothetical protein
MKKNNIPFDLFIAESFIAKEIQDIQSLGVKTTCDIIFGMESDDTFEEVSVKIRDIKAPKNLTLGFYIRKGMDEDESIVNRIIKAYMKYEKVTPFVVDENLKIMDGLHRYVAAKEYLGINATIKVYKKISK